MNTKSLFSFLKTHQKGVFLILLVGLCSVLFYPVLDYQSLLSQGDHGRDLYCFERALEGDLAFKDYWWVYGPLMPYYYAFFYKFLGVNIVSILCGKILLIFLSAVVFYLMLSLFVSPGVSFIASLWYLVFNPDFFFTFNHVGATTGILVTLYCAFLYIKQQNQKYLYSGLFLSLLICLIKINFGITTLVSFLILTFLTDLLNKNTLKKYFYATALIVCPFLIFSIYLFLLNGLTVYEIRQCLPYLSADHPHNATPWHSWSMLMTPVIGNALSGWSNIIFGILILLSTIQTIIVLVDKKTDFLFKRNIFLCLLGLMMFAFFLFHEYLVSGVFYRSFWSKPFTFLFMFIVLSVTLTKVPKIFRFLFYLTLVFVLVIQIPTRIFAIQQAKKSSQYLSLSKAKVFVGNSTDWIQTVTSTVRFLDDHLEKDETFLALPYDPLYYFLCDKKSPTRQLIFFEHINIPENQERSIIQELEDNKVNWIVLSNRAVAGDPGLGILGQTYCPLLYNYLNDHFEIAVTFGPWTQPPGWAWNHATRILKRKKDY